MGNCDSVVKIVVGGKTWYYQKFYDDGGDVEFVNLYDGGGDFVRTYSSLNRLTGSLGAMVRKQKEEEIRRARDAMSDGRRVAGVSVTDGERAEVKRNIVDRINELRGGMSRQEFADKVGMSVGTVREYLVGDRSPSPASLKRIAERCGVTVDWILGANSNKNVANSK